MSSCALFDVCPGPDTTAAADFPVLGRTGQKTRVASPLRRRHRHTTVPQAGQKSGQSPFRQAISYLEMALSTSTLRTYSMFPFSNPTHHFRRLFAASHALSVLNSVRVCGYDSTYPNICSWAGDFRKWQEPVAAMAGMSVRSARKWQSGPLPSETKPERWWRTRPDPFDGVWEEEIEPLLRDDPKGKLKATTIIEWLEEQHPGRFSASLLRTLQRRLQDWRALNGPDQEVYFPQEHPLGREAQFDFTHGNSLGVTVAGQPYPHLLFQLILSHSGWRYAEVTAGETFLALKQGMQNALWALGGVPEVVRSDNTSAATHEMKRSRGRALNDNYAALLAHYGVRSTRINRGKSPRKRRRRARPLPFEGRWWSGHGDRRGADRPRTAEPHEWLRRWSLCRSAGAPGGPGAPCSQRWKQPADRPFARCGFVPKRLPDRVPDSASAGPASPPRDRPKKRTQRRSQPHAAPHFLLRKASNYLETRRARQPLHS